MKQLIFRAATAFLLLPIAPLLAQTSTDAGKQHTQSLSHSDIAKQPAQSLSHGEVEKQKAQSMAHADISKQRAQSLSHGDLAAGDGLTKQH